jgi:hypothetical protein
MMLKRIVDTVKSEVDRQKRLAAFRKAFAEAVQDGIVTPQELSDLDHLASDLGLSEREVLVARTAAYAQLTQAASKDRRLTDAELESLERFRTHFQLTAQESGRDLPALMRFRTLYEIEQGNLPELEPPKGFVMRAGETLHWCEAAKAFEDHARRTKNGPVSEEKLVCNGFFYITSQRLAVLGLPQSLEFKFAQLSNIAAYQGGIQLMRSRGKPVEIRYARENSEVIKLIVEALTAPKPVRKASSRHDISRA